MPLDTVARRYADNIFNSVAQTVAEKQNNDFVRLANEQASRGAVLSGSHVLAQANILLNSIRTMGEAKAEGLLKAYAHSGVPFDEIACSEVKSEVVGFCSHQQDSAVDLIGQKTVQMFGPQVPGGTHDAASTHIVAGVRGIIAQLVYKLDIKRDETILEQRKLTRAYGAGLGKEHDVFISHASEDKDFVRPLADALQKSGLLVWFDEFTLKVGDSLRKKIDEGLAQSRYGIVVLSSAFFAKNWPQLELDGLMSKEVAGTGTKVILPVWHKTCFEEISRYSPMLVGRVGVKSDEGLETVVQNCVTLWG